MDLWQQHHISVSDWSSLKAAQIEVAFVGKTETEI